MIEPRQATNAVSRTKKAVFLKALGEVGDHQQACQVAGIATCTPRQWARRSKEFAEGYRLARVEGDLVLLAQYEQQMHRRIMEGKVDPQSAVLTMFRVKRLDPAYRDNAVVNVSAGGPVAIQLNFGVPAASETETLSEGTAE